MVYLEYKSWDVPNNYGRYNPKIISKFGFGGENVLFSIFIFWEKPSLKKKIEKALQLSKLSLREA